MQIRELTEADLPALLELCQATLPYDAFTLPLLHRRVFDDPEPVPSYRLAAYTGIRLIGAVIGLRRAAEQPPAGGILLLVVAADMHRQGVATQLLDELEQRMRADGLHSISPGGNGPNFFWAGIDMRYTPTYCLLVERGYQLTDIRVNQKVDLRHRDWNTAVEETRLAEQGFTIRRLQADDRAAFSEYMRQHWSMNWHDEALIAYKNTPITAFVATHQDELCAFAAYNIEGFAGHFGPTGTNEAMRGHGLGRILFYKCMADMLAQGLERAEVVWVGPIPFYTKIADAIVHRAFWAMNKQL
ncbi:MAG: GNAT family N-acetyltransferase [Roseiflexaceae bacterium]|nr:GNAT family N-acetyltransferase [Roseiflexaceae bacterium]